MSMPERAEARNRRHRAEERPLVSLLKDTRPERRLVVHLEGLPVVLGGRFIRIRAKRYGLNRTRALSCAQEHGSSSDPSKRKSIGSNCRVKTDGKFGSSTQTRRLQFDVVSAPGAVLFTAVARS